MANNTECGEDKDINFGVTEESEKVLVKDRIATASWVEEDGFEVTIHKKHRNCSS
jgi:hypothetical protein